MMMMMAIVMMNESLKGQWKKSEIYRASEQEKESDM